MSWEKLNEEAWKNRIVHELKGKPFEKLIWKSPEGIDVQPFYTSTATGSTFPRKNKIWHISEIIEVDTAVTSNALALQALHNGASHIIFDANNQNPNLDSLTQGILMDIAPVTLRNFSLPKDQTPFFQKNSNAKLHFGIDPISALHNGADFSSKMEDIYFWTKQRSQHQASWGILAIDGSIYKNAGGSNVHEIAFILSAVQENLHHCHSKGILAKELGNILIYNAVGTNFFFEIAKVRALRQLLEILLSEYGEANFSVISESDSIHSTSLDAETNLLRLSTSAMSAALGGSDSIALHPYNNQDRSRRITRNIQHLLIEESYFGEQLDPVAGSYYIENLTASLKDSSWKLFLDIEKMGGYKKAWENGFIQENIHQNLQVLKEEMANRKAILLGVNQFPNLKDEVQITPESTASSGLNKVRLAEPFEQLRIKTASAISKGRKAPTAFLWQFGGQTMRKARSAYAFNFLACAGIVSTENTDPENEEKSLQEFLQLQPDIVVFCSDNESWEEQIPKIVENLPNGITTVLAGKGQINSMDFSIYDGCNVWEMLDNILKKINIQ